MLNTTIRYKALLFTIVIALIFLQIQLLYSVADERVTLKLSQVPLKTALRKITLQTQVNFIYASAFLDSIVVSCNFSKEPLEDVVRELLKNTRLTFSRSHKEQIVIYVKTIKIDISGKVLDAQSNESLPYANIRIKNSHFGTSTNNEGRFVLKNVRTLPCTLQIRYIGYLSKDFVLKQNQPQKDLVFVLEQTAIPSQEVTVRAENWQIFQISESAGELAISPLHFSDLPIIGDKDISRSLQLMPGIATSNYGASGLYVRGGLPSHNLVLLDGMTLYHMNHSFGFFSAFNSEAIKDVRVYKGGFPARFGGRLSSVIELTAKSGDFNEIRLNSGTNQMSGQIVLEVPLAGRGAILLSGRRSFSKYILGSLQERVFNTISNKISPIHVDVDDVVTTPEAEDENNISFYDLIGKLTLSPSRQDIFTLSYFKAFDRVKSQQKTGVTAPVDAGTQIDEGEESGELESKWANWGVSAKWYRQWRDDLSSTIQLTASEYSAKFESEFSQEEPEGSEGELPELKSGSNNDVDDLTLRVDNSWQLFATHNLDFGFSFTGSSVEYRLRGFDFDDDIESDSVKTIVSTDLFSVYTNEVWSPSSNLNINFGLRSNYYKTQNSTPFSQAWNWEPRLSLKYRLSRHFLLKGAWGRYYQYVLQFGDDFQNNDGDISWVLADHDTIQPAFSEHSILGLKYEDRTILLDIELYHKKLKGLFEGLNYRQFAEPDSLFNPFVQFPGNTIGFDFHLRKKTDRFTGWLSYSFSKTTLRREIPGVVFSYPADQDTPHNLKLAGSFALGSWNFSATWQYVSGKPYSIPIVKQFHDPALGRDVFVLLAPENRNTERLPSTDRLDISLTRDFKNRLFTGKLGLSIYNVYNRKNVWYRYFTINRRMLTSVDVEMFGAAPTAFLELHF